MDGAIQSGGKKYSNEQLRFLSEAYDALYNRAQELLEEYNPCEIIGGECISKMYNFEACCSKHCKYSSSIGCVVENLHCKMYLCVEVLRNNPKMVKRWERLRSYYDQLLYTDPHIPKEEVMHSLEEKACWRWHRTIYL